MGPIDLIRLIIAELRLENTPEVSEPNGFTNTSFPTTFTRSLPHSAYFTAVPITVHQLGKSFLLFCGGVSKGMGKKPELLLLRWSL